jgi:hypothetical protein
MAKPNAPNVPKPSPTSQSWMERQNSGVRDQECNGPNEQPNINGDPEDLSLRVKLS